MAMALLMMDRIRSGIPELVQRAEDAGWIITGSLKGFVDAIDFSVRFVDCICNRSNALELAPHLSSVVTKVEALVQKIGEEFLKQLNRTKLAAACVCFPRRSGSQSQKKIFLRWLQLLQKSVSMMSALKPDIEDALGSLPMNQVQGKIPSHDFPEWKKFVINAYEHVEDVQGRLMGNYPGPGTTKQPSYLEKLLDDLENDQIKDASIEAFLTEFGRSIISAELSCCQWWWRASDPELETGKEDVRAAFQDLEKMIWLTNPEFVDFFFRVLKTSQKFSNIANFVVNLNEPIIGLAFYTLSRELISLMTCVLNMHEEDNVVLMEMFLSDTKQLLMETASQRHLQHEDHGESVAQNLILKILFVKIEILLRTLVTGDAGIQKVNVQVDKLNVILGKIKESSSEGSATTTTTGTKIMKRILMLMEEVAEEGPMLGKSAPMVVRILLLKTLFLKGESMFLKLHDSLLGSFKDYIESLHEGFTLMMPIVIYNHQAKNFEVGNAEFPIVESVASRTISLYHQILAQNISQEIVTNINSSSLPHLHLLDEIKLIMNEINESYLQRVQKPLSPYTNAVGFSDSLRSKLRELLNNKMEIVESIITKKQLSEMIELLESFRPFLQNALEDTMSQELKDLCTRAVKLTYEAEYLVDTVISSKKANYWHNMAWLCRFLLEIRDLKIQLGQKQVKRTNNVKVHMISREATPDMNEEGVVSLLDEEQSILDRLLGGLGKLYSVSLVGMPGIGKTTMAKKVYNSPEVVRHFQIRAWCCVSEVYRRRDVLLEILSHMIAHTADLMDMPDEDLEFKLYQILMTKRYLIVLDDVWDTYILSDLVTKFPDQGNSSRILITSRNDSVAMKANPDADPHHLRQLYDSESWRLLQNKIFHKEPCPDELKEIGQEIAESCKGLPLAVIAIAGLLERIERQHNRWKEIAESLNSKIVDDPQEQWRHILELSYENLPDCLKACFLYFGAFLEDQDIPTWKLMQLWIVEGFVPETELETMEDLAEDYLMDLIGRSLVMLSKQSSTGGAKACRVHDVLRKLCQSKAKEDKFLEVVTRSNANNNVTLHDIDYVFGDPMSSSVVKYEDQYRLCFCSKRRHFFDSRPLGPHVRSLLCFATGDLDPKYPYYISFISQNFRFVKVLDLECINMGTSFAEDILLLVHLKYLAVSGYIQSIPSSIANLWNLETFIVKVLSEKVKLSHQLWSLKRLRHVRVCDFAVLDLEESSSQAQPDCLVTASSLILPFGEKTDCFLKKCRNLRKLKCIFSESKSPQPQEAADKNSNQFPSLEVLNKLESLNITYYGRDVGYGDFSFPSNLKKLTLLNFRLPWDKISVIGGLQKLEVLKLKSHAFVGEEWEMAEGEFLQLKYLKLENLELAKWNANGDNLPILKKLVLRSCNSLEIPEEILEVPTLQIIDVQWCGESVEKSARQIREEGDEKLKIFINFAELQFPSS